MVRGLTVNWLSLALTSMALAGETAPGSTKKPAAVKERDRVKIEFAVDKETDVSVFVENAKGEIVRHLVAGVLGKSPPTPLKANSLEQSLVWDGKDDDGQPAAGGPFTFRVGLGLRASYAGTAFADVGQTGPHRIDAVVGLAVAPDGRLYVMDRWPGLAWWSVSKVLVFRRDGAYEKTIKPFPPNLPLDRLKPIGPFVNSFGAVIPLIYRAEGMAFYPQEEVAQQPAITPDGRIVLAT